MFVFRRLRLTQKIVVAFGAIMLCTAISGVMAWRATEDMSRRGLEIGEELAPLADASMEIGLRATEALLALKAVMSGDPGADESQIWSQLDLAEFFARAIIEGGEGEDGRILPVRSPEARALAQEALAGIASFREAAKARHARLADAQGVGTGADERFDQLYDELIEGVAAVAARRPDSAIAQRAAGDARYLIANGHLLTEEILGGDAGEDESEALSAFRAGGDALAEIAIAHPETAGALAPLRARVAELADLGAQRIARMRETARLDLAAEQAAAAVFERFLSAADAIEGTLRADMRAGLHRLRADRVSARIAGVAAAGVLTLICLLMMQMQVARRVKALTGHMLLVAKGRIETMEDPSPAADELGQMFCAPDEMVAALRGHAAVAERIAKGDLSAAVRLGHALRDMVANLGALVSEAATAAQVSARGAVSMQGFVRDIDANLGQQGDVSSRVASAIDEMAANTKQSSEPSARTREIASRAAQDAEESGRAVTAAIAAIRSIVERIGVIQEIARQTDLLALNAAV